MKNPLFRISLDSKSDPNPVPRWQCHNMLPASIIGKVSAATIMKLHRGASLLSPAAANSKPLEVFTPTRKVLQRFKLFTLWNIFRQKSLGLQPEGGDIDKVTFHVEKSDEAEVGIKTLALKKKVLDVLANPKGGN